MSEIDSVTYTSDLKNTCCQRECKYATENKDNGRKYETIVCNVDQWERIPHMDICPYDKSSLPPLYSTVDDDNKDYVNQIKDSGERTVFPSGAVRDMSENKGDMVSMPWEAILRLSRHYEAGAKKYNRWNYRKGINLSSYIDSACRHLAKYQCGCDDEDHLAAAAFNVLGAMLTEEIMPELIDLPTGQGKNRFCYFESNRDLSAETETVTVK